MLLHSKQNHKNLEDPADWFVCVTRLNCRYDIPYLHIAITVKQMTFLAKRN